jgi:hypothetical protein
VVELGQGAYVTLYHFDGEQVVIPAPFQLGAVPKHFEGNEKQSNMIAEWQREYKLEDWKNPQPSFLRPGPY